MKIGIYQNGIMLLMTILIGFAVNLFAWRLGFYQKVNLDPFNPISYKSTFFAFSAYFLSQIILMPAIAFLYFSWQTGVMGDDLPNLLTPQMKGEALLLIMGGSSALVLLFLGLQPSAIVKMIWNPGELSLKAKLKSVLLGSCTWFIAFPLVIIMGQLMESLLLYLYGSIPDGLDQKAVKYLKELLDYPSLFYAMSILVILVVPMVEEVLFRGFLQSALKKTVGVFASIILTSVFFSVMHYSAEQAVLNVELLPCLFVLSCFLGYLYERERTLWAPIALHMTFNGISVFVL